MWKGEVFMKIVHLSDLHASGANFVREWGDTVLREVNKANPDAIIITGDITDEGYIHEYKSVKSYIESFTCETKLILPGNHDSRNEGYMIFEEMFKTRYPYYSNDKTVIVGIDSSTPDLDDGHIGRANYEYIKERFNNPGKIKMMAMHHHLIPIPGTGRERHIPVDAGDVLKLCMDMNVDIVISGHKHLPWIWNMEGILFITGGTATSRRLKGNSYPSFNIYSLTEGVFDIKEYNVRDSVYTDRLKKEFKGELND